MNVLKYERNGLQEILNDHFSTFGKEIINGIEYDVMPLKRDIPIIKKSDYDTDKDCYTLMFKYSEKLIKEKIDYTTLYETAIGELIGIKVENVSKFNQIFENDLELKKYEICKKTSSKSLRIKSIECRKIEFIKNILAELLECVNKSKLTNGVADARMNFGTTGSRGERS